jgi:hypothetical protein
MGSHKICYGTWGLVVLMPGVSIILGVSFPFDVLGIVTLEALSIGVIVIRLFRMRQNHYCWRYQFLSIGCVKKEEEAWLI